MLGVNTFGSVTMGTGLHRSYTQELADLRLKTPSLKAKSISPPTSPDFLKNAITLDSIHSKLEKQTPVFLYRVTGESLHSVTDLTDKEYATKIRPKSLSSKLQQFRSAIEYDLGQVEDLKIPKTGITEPRHTISIRSVPVSSVSKFTKPPIEYDIGPVKSLLLKTNLGDVKHSQPFDGYSLGVGTSQQTPHYVFAAAPVQLHASSDTRDPTHGYELGAVVSLDALSKIDKSEHLQTLISKHIPSGAKLALIQYEANLIIQSPHTKTKVTPPLKTYHLEDEDALKNISASIPSLDLDYIVYNLSPNDLPATVKIATPPYITAVTLENIHSLTDMPRFRFQSKRQAIKFVELIASGRFVELANSEFFIEV